MSTTLLARAAALLADLAKAGDTTPWPEETRTAMSGWLAEYRALEVSRIRSLPAVSWMDTPPQSPSMSWVEVLTYRYRWSEGIAEGWGSATLYYDTDERVFYRRLQQGYVGHGTSEWQRGIYRQ